MENFSRNTVNLLKAFMLGRGAENWRANFLAHRLTRAFGESAFGVIGAFLVAAWSLDDIYMLDISSPRWRKDPRRVLQTEQVLLEIGFVPIIARRLSWQYAIYSTDAQVVRSAVQAYLDIGLRHNVLYERASRYPDILTLSEDEIRIWREKTASDPRPLEWRIKCLPRRRYADFVLEAVETDWSTTDIRVIYADEVATLVGQLAQTEEPRRRRRRPTKPPQADTVLLPVASTEPPAEEEVIPPEPNVAEEMEAEIASTDEARSPTDDLQTDAEPTTEETDGPSTEGEIPPSTSDAEDVGSPAGTTHADDSDVAACTSPVPIEPAADATPSLEAEELTDEEPAKPVQEVIPDIVPSGDIQDIAALADLISDEPDDTDEADDADSPGASDDIDPEPASILLDALRKALQAHDPSWFERHWKEFLAANPWLNQDYDKAWECVELLMRWFDLRGTTSPHDPRLGFFASFVRNENFPAKKRLRELRIKAATLKRSTRKTAAFEARHLDTEIYRALGLIEPQPLIAELEREIAALRKKRNNGTKTQRTIEKLWARIDRMRRFSALGSFLRLEPEIAFIRLYAARSILEYDSQKHLDDFFGHPEFLLNPFERVAYGSDVGNRGFSIPPPAMDDIRTIQAKCNELRYRANEIRRYTDKPWKKPYIDMLLEPSREKFLKRLERYLANLSEKEKLLRVPRARHRRKGRSVYSTLYR